MRQSEGPRFWKGASPGLMVPVLRPFGDPAHWRPGGSGGRGHSPEGLRSDALECHRGDGPQPPEAHHLVPVFG